MEKQNNNDLAHANVSATSDRSPRFLDQDQPKDELNFLSSKFPNLIKESESLPEQAKKASISKTQFLKMMKDLALSETYNPIMFNLNNPEAQTQRLFELKEIAKHRANNPAATIFEEFFYKSKNKSDINILSDIALAAHHIDDILIRNGKAPLIFLGRTPCFVQVAYEELFKQKYPEFNLKEHSIHLSFSGTPDTMNLRHAAEYQNNENNIKRNLISPEKLAFYHNYLTSKGLNNIHDKLYIV